MNPKNTPISIVVLNWNGLRFLEETIPPLLSLDYSNYEVIVVDNGSTDKSVKFLEKFKRIKIIKNKKNLGYSKGKNIGISLAKGEYILSLDNDISINDKSLLKKLLKAYKSKKNIGFLQIPLIDKGKNKTYYYGIYYSIYGLNMHRKEVTIEQIMKYEKDLIKIVGPTGGFFFIKKTVWKDIGCFDESQMFHIDDVDIGPRSMIFGYKNYLYTSTYAIHLGIKKNDSAKTYANRLKFLFSGHARSMIKNYRTGNLIWAFPSLVCYQTLKAIKYSIKKRSPKVFFGFLYSGGFFLKNLLDTLKERKAVQSKRKIKEDIFLKIKPPKFN
jgi:GT2 family glycosyltransferase